MNMVIVIFGESCTGKSTLAEQIAPALGAEICTGKDYLRLAKSEAEAERIFRARLASDEKLVYIASEPAQLALVPDGCVRIHARASLVTIQSRFAARMHGALPAPVAQMLERKHGIFDDAPRAFTYDSDQTTAEEAAAQVLGLLAAR